MIHSIVHGTGHVVLPRLLPLASQTAKKAAEHPVKAATAASVKSAGAGNQKIREFAHRWIPAFAGLAAIPALPYCIDEPVEHAVHQAFENYDPMQYLGFEARKGGKSH